MAYSISRMTLYAILSSIEEDLRKLIKDHCSQREIDKLSGDKKLITKSIDRYEKDIGSKFTCEDLTELVDYFDLGDTYQFVNGNQNLFPEHLTKVIKACTKFFERLVVIRNRVMHIRPLNFDDPEFVQSFIGKLLESPSEWPNLEDVSKRINDDPSFVLQLEIPLVDDTISIPHNLPIPDFDETGLLGREDEISKLKKACYGPYPVISIVGEGGVGKSALALKVAYDILEDPKCPYDVIIWVTSKTNQISATEIRDIKGAISTSLGVLSEISSQLSGVEALSPLEEIVEYMESFKILLFIDNLETILDNRIKTFIESLQIGSKIVITSRIGLGAYEYPIKLNGISESHSSQLLRILSRVRGVKHICTLEEGILRKYCKRMHFNPGYIKWFVSAVQTGLAPELVLQNSKLFLEFCMSNVYNHLSDSSKNLISTMQCSPGWKDMAELAYLGDFDSIDVQQALQELQSTNILAEATKVIASSVKTTYQLAELPRSYLQINHRPEKIWHEKIKRNRNRLVSLFEEINNGRRIDKYSFYNVKIRTKTDRVIAKNLYDVLARIRKEEYSEAYELLEEARRLSPEYFEVHRVLAFLNVRTGNYPEARDSYELAIELDPSSPQVRYWFAGFLMRYEDSTEEALVHFKEAYKLDEDSIPVSLELARAYLYNGDYSDCMEVLESLEKKIEGLDRKSLSKYHDLRFQRYYREADTLCKEGHHEQSIEMLDSMRNEFDSIPITLIDVRLRQKLNKIFYTIEILKKSFPRDSIEAIKTDEIDRWAHLEYNKI